MYCVFVQLFSAGIKRIFRFGLICRRQPDGRWLTEDAPEHCRERCRALIAEVQGDSRHRFTRRQPCQREHHAGPLPPFAEAHSGLLAKHSVEGA